MKRNVPTVQAFVLADEVFQARGGKFFILGTFNQVLAQRGQFPVNHIGAKGYLVLKDAEGDIPLTFRLMDLQDYSAVMELPEVKVPIPSALGVFELRLEYPPLHFPHPGSYAFEAWSGESQIAAIKLEAIEVGGDPA